MQCLHMSGAGNDFMVIDARGQTLDLAQTAKDLCAITGADGFMALDTSEIADFRLHYYNADGSRGEMCGNGSRCICRFAYDLGIVGSEMTIQTDAGIVTGWRLTENDYRVRLPRPVDMDMEAKPGVAYGVCGVPHALVELPELDWNKADMLLENAKTLRYDSVFPKGANVDFYCWESEDTVRVLTYERGVEDYTLACGTGCGALAAVLYFGGRLPGNRLICHNRGGTLRVQVEEQGGLIMGLLLDGPTEIIATFPAEKTQ